MFLFFLHISNLIFLNVSSQRLKSDVIIYNNNPCTHVAYEWVKFGPLNCELYKYYINIDEATDSSALT